MINVNPYIDDAINLINTVGFIKGAFSDCENGKIVGYCILGALSKVTPNIDVDKPTNEQPFQVIYTRLMQHVPNGNIVAYNDDRSTTKQDIINLLTRAKD